MSTNAISSMGTKFFRWSGSAWVTISEVTGIDGPSRTRETLDVTNLDSDDNYREFIADLKDGGTINVSMNFYRTTFDLLDADFESATPGNYAIVLPDSGQTSIEFEGLVTELPLSAQVGDKITANVTIKVTGKPVIGTGSSGGVESA